MLAWKSELIDARLSEAEPLDGWLVAEPSHPEVWILLVVGDLSYLKHREGAS